MSTGKDTDRDRCYYQKHRQRILAARKLYYQEHRDVILARVRAWQQAHPEQVRSSARARRARRHRQRRQGMDEVAQEQWQALQERCEAWKELAYLHGYLLSCYRCGRQPSGKKLDRIRQLKERLGYDDFASPPADRRKPTS